MSPPTSQVPSLFLLGPKDFIVKFAEGYHINPAEPIGVTEEAPSSTSFITRKIDQSWIMQREAHPLVSHSRRLRRVRRFIPCLPLCNARMLRKESWTDG